MRNQEKRTKPIVALLVAVLVSTSWFAWRDCGHASVVNEAANTANPLIGMWEMSVVGNVGTYLYKYAISDGTWVALGNIDLGFLNYRYSPTVGAYVKNADGSYSYRERGWTFTRGGVCNGSLESTGTFVLDSDGITFRGPGTYRQFDLAGNTILTENFTVVATKIGV